MEILGYSLAVAIGVSLGLIGGGGSILAVPVLAYLFGMDEKVATAYSLFIVGTAALVGGLRQHRHGSVDWRTAVVFGLPAIGGVWAVRHYIVPALPDVLFTAGSLEFTRRMGMFGLFAVLMMWAALAKRRPALHLPRDRLDLAASLLDSRKVLCCHGGHGHGIVDVQTGFYAFQRLCYLPLPLPVEHCTHRVKSLQEAVKDWGE